MSLMTDPNEMRVYAGKFQGHADAIQAESAKVMASAQSVSGGSWKGLAEAASFNTMSELDRAFRNIHEMMTFTSQNLNRSADTYEHNEQTAASALRS
ncbi:MAG: hypothetical protein QG597_3788 [Actinomycetota bacterium]|nr:hypothetical protein [Actinomycetota bacterium]